MLYYIYNDTPIDAIAYETTMKQIPFAFAAWERAVYYSKLKFVQTNTTPESGIIIKIVDNHADEKLTYNDLVDAQANTEIFTNYTLITGGTMTTEAYKGAYAARTVAEHGIGHILGFDNCGTKVSIMYETFLTGEVQQKITNDLIAALNVLYKNVPASD
jgi:predicted Zn-dependent protease